LSKMIISLWPMQESCYRAMHMPKTTADSNTFVLQPGSLAFPTMLQVNEFNNKVYMGAGNSQMLGISAEEIAHDLVNIWRNHKGSSADEGLPAIWVCSLDNPTVEQVKQLPETMEWYESQRLFANSKVREARLFAAQSQWRNITKLHLFMGALLNVQGEPWQDFDSKNQIAKVRCPYCDHPMTMGAAICGQCREIVNLEKYNQIRVSQDLPTRAVAAAPKPS